MVKETTKEDIDKQAPVTRAEFEKLQSDLSLMMQWGQDINRMVVPSLDSAIMLALYTMSKSGIELNVPKDWDSKEYMPIQKTTDEMSQVMDAAAKKHFEKMESLNADSKGKSI